MFNDLHIPANYYEGATLFRGRGCDRCNNTGYAGRTAILEAMTITDEIRKLVIGRASAMEIAKVAQSQGMKTCEWLPWTACAKA
jgi:type IV pilus assembly protein PilB